MISHGTTAVPVRLEISLVRLAENCVPRTLRNILRKKQFLKKIEFPNLKIAYVRDIAESPDDGAKAFEFPRIRVTSALEHGLDLYQDIDGNILLLNRIVNRKFSTGSTKARKATPVAKKEIKNHCTSQVQASITRGWVNSVVLRYPDEIIQRKSVSSEEQRLHVPKVFRE
jgi:hypothetical protein